MAQGRVKKHKTRGLKLNEDNDLARTIVKFLKESWSPEQIAGYLRRMNDGKNVISHETIYRWIYSDFGKRNRYYAFLRRKRLWRTPRGIRKCRAVIPGRVSIADRPEIIGQRDGKKMAFNSITFDNGSEFFAHLDIVKALGGSTFFCDPYKSWQKGSVENGNGVLRFELPRTTPINGMSQKEINRLVQRINRRPMKCLGYRSSEKVFNENMNRLSGIL